MKFAKYKKAKEWSVKHQVEKIEEELGELKLALKKGNKQQILGEGFDLKQTVETLFDILGYTEDEIITHLSFHYQKLEHYWTQWELNRKKRGYASIPLEKFEKELTQGRQVVLDYLTDIA